MMLHFSKRPGAGAVFLLIVGAGTAGRLFAAHKLEISFRVYVTIPRVGTAPAGPGVPASFRHILSGHMPAAGDMESERAGIIRTFHLHEARLAMEAGLIIGEGGQAPDRVRLPFSIEGRPCQIVLLITEFRPPIRLFAVVLERSATGFSGVLAETLEMRADQSTVLGFESGRGTYFLTFRITGPRDMVPLAPPPPPPPPRLGEEEAGFEEFARGAVKVDLDLIPPRLIKIVDPTLPAGRPAPAQGAHVSLYLRIDEQGRVVAVHSVYSTDKELERSAISAVRQWTYEPYLAEGKPSPAVIPVTVRFGPD